MVIYLRYSCFCPVLDTKRNNQFDLTNETILLLDDEITLGDYQLDSVIEEMISIFNDDNIGDVGSNKLNSLFNETFSSQELINVSEQTVRCRQSIIDSKFTFNSNFIEGLMKEIQGFEHYFIRGSHLNTIEDELSIHHSVKRYIDSLIFEYRENDNSSIITRKDLEQYFVKQYGSFNFAGNFMHLISKDIGIEDLLLLQQIYIICLKKIYEFYNLSPEKQLLTNSIAEYGVDSLLNYVIKRKQLCSIDFSIVLTKTLNKNKRGQLKKLIKIYS